MAETFLTIVSKRDHRDFDPRPLLPEEVGRILDAGRLSGSARNRQPWRFFTASSAAARSRLAPAVYVPPMVMSAPFAVALAADTEGSRLWGFDVGRAAQNMMLAAWDMGIASCPNGVQDPDRLGHELALGQGWTAVSVLAFGRPVTERSPARRALARWIAGAPRRPAADVVVDLDAPPGRRAGYPSAREGSTPAIV